MPAVTTLAMVGLAVSAVGAAVQYSAGQDAKKASGRQAQAQREQAALEQQRADINNARQLRASLRQARIARGTVVNAGAIAGTSQSSGVIGGASSLVSQSGANVDYYNQMGDLNTGVMNTQVEQANAQQDMGEAQGTAALGGALGGLGSSIFSGAGGYKTIFSKTA